MSWAATRSGQVTVPPRSRARAGTGASGPVRRALGADLIARLEQLCGRPTVGLFDVVGDLAAVVAAAVVGEMVGHGIGPLLAVCYIGVRQRHLSNLAHECVHSKLVGTRRGNRAVGYLLTGLLGEGFLPYRTSHYVHHAKLGSDDDPMFQSYRAGNIRAAGPAPSRLSFVLRVIVRNAVWRLPKTATLTLLSKAPEESWRSFTARAALWGAVVAVCWPLGALPVLALYWLIPLILVRPVITWITDLGNHAGVIDSPDPLLQIRGWSSHWLTRHLLGGHLDDMFHPIHHWCPQIPWRRLPEAAALAEQHLPRWREVPWCSGYFFRRRGTPDRPCVIEDIIARLSHPGAAPTATEPSEPGHSPHPALSPSRGDDPSAPHRQGGGPTMTVPQAAARANSFDEWSRLRQVVVGRAEHYTDHDADLSWLLFYFENVAPVLADRHPDQDPEAGRSLLSLPPQLVDELNEDIAGLVEALSGCGVDVLRPAAPGKDVDIASPWWTARATPPLNVRDQTIVLGNTIVETAPHIRGRIFENDLLKPIFYRYYGAGSNWLAMPRPALSAGTLDAAYFTRRGVDVSRATDTETAQGIDGLGLEMVFDGAQCVRLGRDVLVNVANGNHELAFRWLRDNLPQLRFHRLNAMADNHVDSIVVPLRPGLMLLRSPEYLPYLPSRMQSWQAIYPPAMTLPEPDYSDFGFVIPTASRYIDINVLSIDENTVVVNSHYPELIAVLEQHRFTVVPVQHRHRRLFGGGFHCFTLDTVRDGGSEDYLT